MRFPQQAKQIQQGKTEGSSSRKKCYQLLMLEVCFMNPGTVLIILYSPKHAADRPGTVLRSSWTAVHPGPARMHRKCGIVKQEHYSAMNSLRYKSL